MSILTKKSILKKTVTVGSSTLLSRILGLFRESLLAHYLPLGVISDAFFTAYKIPNSLRKVFAEGALSSVFIPTIIKMEKNGNKDEIDSLMSLSFLVFEGVLLILCFIVFLAPNFVIWFTTPGFNQEQIEFTKPLLRILIFFIMFLSCSSLLTGALQAAHHFFVPAFAPVLLNIVFISAIALGIKYNLPVTFLCYAILVGGLLQFILHLIAYFRLNFKFGIINDKAWKNLLKILIRFFPILFTSSIMELIFFIDEGWASYLPAGSISLIYYANRFMGIPLGVFATAFSTILLPHFSRVSTYAPKRLSFYLFESIKLIFWITVPVTILMIYFADKIFITLFLSDKFPMSKVIEAHYILIAFVIGLFFFSINKILTNIFYSMNNTIIPTLISIIALTINIGLNYALITRYKAIGLASAMTFSLGLLQTILLFIVILKKYNFTIYPKHLIKFIINYILQLIIGFICFFLLSHQIENLIKKISPSLENFLLNKIGFWLWVGPLCLLLFLALYKTKKLFKVKLYFLD